MRRANLGLSGLIVLVLGFGAVGCIRPFGPGGLKREVSASAGVDLDREFGITVTRSGIWLARKILRWTDADHDMPPLKGLRRVSVGVYRVDEDRRGVRQARRIDAELFSDWDSIVRMHDGDESIYVLTRPNRKGEGIKHMMVIVADSDEWVLVKMKGRLDRILEDAIAFGFDQADRPDLYERTRERRHREADPEQRRRQIVL